MNKNAQVRRSLVLWILLAWSVLSTAVAHAIPDGFTISGVLKDGTGALLPDASNVAVEVVFYDSETTGTMLGNVTATTNIVDGVFSARIVFPSVLLSEDQLWYTMAIDTDGNGLDGGDLFDGRYSVSSVPFSLSGTPAGFFNTHGGWVFGSSSDLPANKVYLSPFMVPPGGIDFNILAFRAQGAGEKLANIGIYDDDGNRVYETTPIIVYSDSSVPGTNGTYYAVPMEGTLLPSKTYFVAIVTTASNLGFFYSPNSTWPFAGTSDLFTTNATLPESLDPFAIKTGTAYNLTLIKTDSEAKRAKLLSKRAGKSAEGYPIYYPVSDDPVDLSKP